MKKILKWIAIVIAVLIVIALALPFLINVNSFKPQIESQLTDALGRKVTLGNLKLSILSGSLGADDIAIADDSTFSSAPFIRAHALNVGVELMPLIFSKQLHVTELSLTEPQITLLRAPSGKWNYSTLGANAASKPAAPASYSDAANKPAAPASTSDANSFQQNLSVGKLTVKDGRVSIAETKAPAKAHVYDKVNIEVKNFSFSSQFPFTLSAGLPGGGTLKLDGTAGPINPTDTAQTPLQAKLEVKKLDLGKSGFVDPSTGIAGVADFDGTVTSDGKEVQTSGKITADSLKLSPKGTPSKSAVMLHYATTYELQKQTGRLTQGDVSLGKAVAKLGGAYDLGGESPALNMKLNADNMPVDDLVTMLPALGVVLPSGSSLQGGTLSADLTVVGPVDRLVINGPVKLVNTKLAGFDMASKLSSVLNLGGGAKSGSDTTIQNFSSDVHVAPGGIQTQNVNLVVPSLGTVKGNGTVSPQNALDYKMSASLSGGLGGGLTAVAGGGKGGIPFFIQGTASDPKFVPDVKGMLGSQLNDRLGGQIPGGKSTQGLTDAVGGLFGKKKKQ
jgi:AsmA protein